MSTPTRTMAAAIDDAAVVGDVADEVADVASDALEADEAAAHHAPSLPGVNLQPPCSGYFDRFGIAHPSYHHIVPSTAEGDVATDWYCPPGAAVQVQVRAWPVSQQGGTAYRVARVVRACASGVYSQGGDAVKVEIHYSGQYIGFVWYFHISGTRVSPGQWIGHGTTIGYTARFTRSSCYDVSTNEGVHVHLQWYSNRHYGCYINYRSGTYVPYWGVFGRIGGDYAHSIRRPCP